jgi:hypothetical protein
MAGRTGGGLAKALLALDISREDQPKGDVRHAL